jgi:hypothetical protein
VRVRPAPGDAQPGWNRTEFVFNRAAASGSVRMPYPLGSPPPARGGDVTPLVPRGRASDGSTPLHSPFGQHCCEHCPGEPDAPSRPHRRGLRARRPRGPRRA